MNLLKNKIEKIQINKNISYESYLDSDNILNLLEKDKTFKNKYKMIETIYDKYDKATGIIKDGNNHKYFIKIKTCDKKNINREYIIYKLLKNRHHDNIIKFIEYSIKDKYHYFIYEHFEGITLFKYISNYALTNESIVDILLQLANAIKFLHSLNILHCDIKLENILINTSRQIKLIDFDLSIYSPDDEDYVSDSVFGTIPYIAPESYDLCIYSKKSDVWEIGILAYVMIVKKYPNNQNLTLINSYGNLDRNNIFKHLDMISLKKEIKINKYNEQLYTLIKKMLKFKDSERIDINEIIRTLDNMAYRFTLMDQKNSTSDNY